MSPPISQMWLCTDDRMEMLGPSVLRAYPVSEEPCFEDLIQAIDVADREVQKPADGSQGKIRMDQTERCKPTDENRVNINNPGESHYWCVLFQCTPSQLEITVRKVGTDAREVRRHLASLWQGSAR